MTPRVLIIDDDVAMLDALPAALSLRLENVVVDTASSGTTALERIAAEDFDAIVSDIKMPGKDGLTLLADVRKLRPDTPMLLITGHGETELAVQALRGGAYDFVQKPIDRDYFVETLKRAIQVRQLRQEVERQRRALEQHASRLEATVAERTSELSQAVEIRDEFLSIASHELKTPLTALQAHLQILLRAIERGSPPPQERLARGLQAAEQQCKRLVRLVDGLLDISRLTTGPMPLHRQEVDLAILVREVCERLHEELAQAGCMLRLEIEPAPGRWDQLRIEQVVTNLLSNAIKFGAGKPVEVVVHRRDSTASLEVRDHGIGIDEVQRAKIFERFERATSFRNYGGFGLGLYITRQIVKAHGGTIDVEGRLGEGANFRVELPAGTSQ